uniref:F-box protein n=1 Tax=Noccaea caerulescens TaxID=107243 RepID=A0A1J3EUU6_NOCCA
MKRYQNLMIGEAFSNNHLYPFSCNELSSILNLGYSRLPKDLKAVIFQDTLSAFRLLPEMNTSAAVSAANLLLKSAEAVLPKQKKNLAIAEFKKAKVAFKRRSKSHEEEDIDLPSLPHDILIHIFTFLDVSSLLSSSQVSRSWNQATYDDSLWRSQFDLHFKHKFLTRIQSGIDLREAFKKEYLASYSSNMLRSGRGYCNQCESVVWLHNLRCPNKQCRLKSGNKPLVLMSSHQVVNYLLGVVSSSDDSETEDEADTGLWVFVL